MRKMSSHFMMAILIFWISCWIGCAASYHWGPSRLGQYTYIHAEPYLGPPLRVIPIWIDKNFGEADKVSIDDAVSQWNFVLNGYIKLKVVDTHFDMEVDKIQKQQAEDGWLFMKITSDNKMIPSQNDKGFWTIGFANKIGGDHLYLVRDRLGNQDIFGVTLHEIGHLLGSDHVGERLMFKHYSRPGYQCADYLSVQAVASFQDLQISHLNYCIDVDVVEAHKPDAGPTAASCPVGYTKLD